MSTTEDDLYTQAMFGQHARRAAAWLYVQDHGSGAVSFVGAARIPDSTEPHPFRYGSDRTHQFVVGEIVLRPHVVVATDALRGTGLAGLVSSGWHDLDKMRSDGEVIIENVPLNRLWPSSITDQPSV